MKLDIDSPRVTSVLPRSIEPEEIKDGQTVRAERRDGSWLVTYEGIARRDGQYIRLYDKLGGTQKAIFHPSAYTWALLAEAPTSTPKPWRQQIAGELRAWADVESRSARYCGEYATGSVDSARRIANAIEKRNIGASIPDIPVHGDGCSPWLWDKETDSAWVETQITGGVRTYQQVTGNLRSAGVAMIHSLLGDRLVPW